MSARLAPAVQITWDQLLRLFFVLFYLWHLSQVFPGATAHLPKEEWRPVFLASFLPRPSVELVTSAQFVLVAALPLILLRRLRTAATILVVVTGCLVEGTLIGYGKVEHGSLFLVVFIPVIMLAAGWHVGGRQKEWTGLPWPASHLLILLSFHYLSAFFVKAVSGPWLTDPGLFERLLFDRRIEVTMAGNGLGEHFLRFIFEHKEWMPILKSGVLIFEATFFLSLFGQKLRRLFLAAALCFHAGNALFLDVTFSSILAVYPFVWKPPVRMSEPEATATRDSNRIAYILVPILSVGLAVGWNTVAFAREVWTWGGLLDQRNVWFVIGPAAVLWFAYEVIEPMAQKLRPTKAI